MFLAFTERPRFPQRLRRCDRSARVRRVWRPGRRRGADPARRADRPNRGRASRGTAQPDGPPAHRAERVAGFADSVVTMTSTARDRLVDGYTLDGSKVTVIPHGAPVGRVSHVPAFRGAPPLVLSWGLLGPGKGIEWGIEAMSTARPAGSDAALPGCRPDPPESFAPRGRGLSEPTARAGDGARVGDDRSPSTGTTGIGRLSPTWWRRPMLSSPYDSTDQVTSGVLVEAVAAGRPVVATRPHAVEMLKDGGGILVPHQDPTAIADALRTVLTRRTAPAPGPDGSVAMLSRMWPAVADRTQVTRRPVDQSASGGVTASGTTAAPVYDHLIRLTDDRGVLEHARYDEPPQTTATASSSVARALVVVAREPNPGPDLAGLVRQSWSSPDRPSMRPAEATTGWAVTEAGWMRRAWVTGGDARSGDWVASRRPPPILRRGRRPYRVSVWRRSSAHRISVPLPARHSARERFCSIGPLSGPHAVLLNDAVAAIGVDRPIPPGPGPRLG